MACSPNTWPDPNHAFNGVTEEQHAPDDRLEPGCFSMWRGPKSAADNCSGAQDTAGTSGVRVVLTSAARQPLRSSLSYPELEQGCAPRHLPPPGSTSGPPPWFSRRSTRPSARASGPSPIQAQPPTARNVLCISSAENPLPTVIVDPHPRPPVRSASRDARNGDSPSGLVGIVCHRYRIARLRTVLPPSPGSHLAVTWPSPGSHLAHG